MPLKNAAVSVASRARIARLAHDRVHVDQKKVAQLPLLRTTVVAPDPEDPTSTILEPYRLWSFVLKKATNSWIWIALCRKTRQVVAYAVGDRSKKTCQRLWEAIASEYRQGHCFTDFVKVYASVIAFRAAHGGWAKRREKLPMWSAGITRYDSVWLVLSV